MRFRVLSLLLLGGVPEVWAQDPFEIHIYEYEPQSWKQYSLEAHLNFDPQGTALRDGGLLPTQDQTHLTLERAGGAPD